MSTKSFRSYNLYSKKEYILSNEIVESRWFSVTAVILYSVFIFETLRTFNLTFYGILELLLSYYLVDFFTGLVHAFFIDDVLNLNKDCTVKNDELHVHIVTGYSSLHHLFPDNWNDVKDPTMLKTYIFFYSPFLLLNIFLGSSFVSLTSWFVLLSGFSHKYSHMHSGRSKTKVELNPILKFLFDKSILLNSKIHIDHHSNPHKAYGLLSGHADLFTDAVIEFVCKLMNTENVDSFTKICDTLYAKTNCKNFIVHIRGDINGVIKVVRIKQNLFLIKENCNQSI
jgi:hypothetical protein